MTDARMLPGSDRRSRRLRGAVFAASAAVYGLWLVLGMIDNLVWMPQLIAPSVPLARIYVVLTEAGSAPGVVAAPVLWFLLWAAAGLAFVIVLLPAHPAFRRIAATTPQVSVVGIGLGMFGSMAFFEWCSGFGMGMEVSDELPPYVGDTTPFGLFCFAGGAVIALIGGVLWLIGVSRGARSPGQLTGAPR